jgi:hypothetical protein
MTTEQPHYGRGRKPINDKYIEGMKVGEERTVHATAAKVGSVRAGIHAAGFRYGMSIETTHDSVAEMLFYRRIK